MRHWLLLITGLLVSGCVNTDMQDLKRYADDVKKRAPQPIEPIPEIRQVESYLYVPGGRRSPFQRFGGSNVVALQGPSDGPRPDTNRRKEELEEYPLDTLKLVGSIERMEQMWGLIKTSEGTIHRVREGNHLGQNYGLITSIREEEIVLRELVQDGRGGYVERKASLTLAGK